MKAKVRFLGDDYEFDTFGPNDHVSSILLSGRMYEPDLLTWMASLDIKPGSAFIDCGAYLGTHSCFAMKRLGMFPYAFEPHRRARDKARANLEANTPDELSSKREKQYRLFAGAISKKGGTFSMSFPENSPDRSRMNYGNAELVHNPDGAIPSWTGEAILGELPYFRKAGLIKIDCEGMSFEVLMEMRPLLRKYRCPVCIEGSREQLGPVLERLGYRHDGEFCATPVQAYVHYTY
jgi:FkbM family methyltransferase